MARAPVHELFDRVESIAAVLEAERTANEELGHLGDATLAALRGAGLLALKVPAELGGFEAEPALQYEVFERVAYHNAAAAWCLFINADTAGLLGAHLDDEGLAEVFADGVVPFSCGGGGLRPGRLQEVDGGVLLDGSFRYGSAIHGAEWVMVSGYLGAGAGGRGQVLNCVLPRDDVIVAGDWDSHGLRATGSSTFRVESIFVPRHRLFDPTGPHRRGGAQYRAGVAGYLSYTVPAVCTGVARRCLDALIAEAPSLRRGYTRAVPLSERGSFHHFLGSADMRIAAARALVIADGVDFLQAVSSLEQSGHESIELRAREARTRAAAAYATHAAADVLHELVRWVSGASLERGSPFEQALRDVTMASSHLLMSESALENHARFILGLSDADPLA
ncbi:MAG: hypothetical protein IT196_03255 [Acidimicrobiales bacterium]|nr:hypothetical protein [Acidimicrobiales bacterium]